MNHQRILIIVMLYIALFIFPALSEGQPVQLQKHVSELFGEQVPRAGVTSGFLLLHSASMDLHIEFARADTSQISAVTSDTPFYTASITKSLTAAVVMKLAENGVLDIDEVITEYLPHRLTDSLHVFDGIDYTGQITLHHLLSHTSGLADYFTDEPISGSNMLTEILQQPDRFWEADELISFAKDRFSPHFLPGEGFHYSDTGYVLLGLIAEETTGKNLHELYSEIIFEPLQMSRSYMNLRSEPADERTHPMASLHAGPYTIGHFLSLSADWGGGGVVSTLNDLLAFSRVLNSDGLLGESSRRAMKQWRTESSQTSYGYGLRKWVVPAGSSNSPAISLIGHTGATGSFMYYSPELDLHVIGTFNQTETGGTNNEYLSEIVNLFSTY